MSVLSVFRRGRRAAKEHNAKQAELRKKEGAKKTPYRHTPTHAAIDSLLSAPASARIADRARVVEENRKRSIMTANGMGMTTPTHSVSTRAHSSLSHVSYPTTYASPVVHMPRAYSYSSMPATAACRLKLGVSTAVCP